MVRVDGVQISLIGDEEQVSVVPAVRGSSPMAFDGRRRRSMRMSGFLSRYASVEGTDEAALSVLNTRAAPVCEPRTREATVSEKQREMFSRGGSTPEEWGYDAIVLNAGIGGPALGIQCAGLNPIGVESDPECAADHRLVAGPCECAFIPAWKPAGKAKLVFCAQPASPFIVASTAKEDAEITDDTDDTDVDVGDSSGASDDEEEGGPGPVKDPRVAHAFTVATACGADVVIVEVSAAKRGNKRDLASIDSLAYRSGYKPFSRWISAEFLGLPQTRPTLMMVAMRIDKDDDPSNAWMRWPLPTHGPVGNLSLLPRFVSVRDALGLERSYLKDDPDAPKDAPKTWRIDVDAPSPTLTTSGLRAKITPDMELDGTKPEPWKLGLPQIATLQGLPAACGLTPPQPQPASKKAEKAHAALLKRRTRAALAAFPPPLAEAIVTAALASFDSFRSKRDGEAGTRP